MMPLVITIIMLILNKPNQEMRYIQIKALKGRSNLCDGLLWLARSQCPALLTTDRVTRSSGKVLANTCISELIHTVVSPTSNGDLQLYNEAMASTWKCDKEAAITNKTTSIGRKKTLTMVNDPPELKHCWRISSRWVIKMKQNPGGSIG
jgi:hypothetical protein